MNLAPTEVSRDLIETIVAGVPLTRDHKRLVAALRRASRLDTLKLGNERDGYSLSTPHCLVVTPDGESLGKYREWAARELAATGGDYQAVWHKHKGGPLRLVIADIHKIRLVAAYGPDVADFTQLTVSSHEYFVERNLFDDSPYSAPRSVEDLLDPSMLCGALETRQPYGTPFYELDQLVDFANVLKLEVLLDEERKAQLERRVIVTRNMRTGEERRASYFDEYPEQRALRPRLTRFFSDWRRSSAGRAGHVLTDHWVFEISDYTEPTGGTRHLTVIPAWTSTRKLPELKPKRSQTVFGLWDDLLRFDVKAGHPLAWFFYMLHGNRIGSWAGEKILDAAEAGQIVLPEHDYAVLRQWAQMPYGF